MKKKIILMAICFTLAFTSVACGSKNDSKEKETAGVDKKITTVDIKVPYSMFVEEGEEINKEEIEAAAKENGMKSVKFNDDRTLTYTMSKTKHTEMVTEMEKGMKDYMDEIASGDDYPSIIEIKPNKNYTEYELVVDKEGYENGYDGMIIMGLYIQSSYYQIFNGSLNDDYQIKIIVKDKDNGKVIEEMMYPEEEAK